MQMNRRFAVRTLQLLLLGAVVAALLAAVPVSTDKAAMPIGKLAPATTPVTGTFTGEYENGVPVYRLPPVAITANRKEEIAKMEREDRLAAAWQQPNPVKAAVRGTGN